MSVLITEKPLCVVLNKEDVSTEALSAFLKGLGYEPSLHGDPASALDFISNNKTDLIIVQDADFQGMSGPEFINEVMKISWTTNSVFVSKDNPESVHERTEGLGILGSVSGFDDLDAMKDLLNRTPAAPVGSNRFPPKTE
jgi:CheY-like chemotaxis protein